MKNKNYLGFIKFLIIFCLFSQISYSQNIKFEAENIETSENNYITATTNVVIKDDLGTKIYGDKLIIDKNKNTYTITGNVKLEDEKNSLIINSNKIIFSEIENTIKTFDQTKINKKNKYFLETQNVLFDRNKKRIISNDETLIKDIFNNQFKIQQIDISTANDTLIAKNVELTDKDLNIYFLKDLYYDFKKGKILGKDIFVNQDNKISSKKFLPRMKSKSLIAEKDKLNFSKTVYTNCKKRDGCPPWLFQAEEIEHDKKRQIINYKNALLKIYDIPVMYFPKFFHPDPSVERQSGFLTPSISTNNTSSFFSIPYFFEISSNSDFTLSPRFYDNNKTIYQGEYRLLTKNSNHIFDASIKNNNLFLNKKKTSESHFFSKSTINSNFNYFNQAEVNFEIQATSNDKYLKLYDLNSPIITSQSTLNSKINFEASNESLDLSISAEAFEDLSKPNDSDRYEFILPNFNITKNFKTKFDGFLTMSNLGYQKLFDTNINEKVLINNLSYKSFDKITDYGIINSYEIFVKNFNAESKNSKYLKNKRENDLQGIVQFNSSLPLKKQGFKFSSSLTPIFVAKYNPYKNKNIKNSSNFVDYNNIYSINRIGSNETLEGNSSITIGNEFKIFNNTDNTNEIFGINLATSIRDKKNDDLSEKSSLGEKASNIVGQVKINPSDFIDLKYDFLSDNNFGEFKYHNINSTFKVNNFITTFEFIEENDEIGKESFLANETSYVFNNNKSLKFRTRKNKKTDLTEYYNLIYQYKMDCLTAGIEYRKKYYNDGEIKPEESLFFSITLMPFGNSIDLPGINK